MKRNLANLPEAYTKIYNKAVSGKSRNAAIKAFCLECCAYEREEVHHCSDPHCPLYKYRPYQRIRQPKQAP